MGVEQYIGRTIDVLALRGGQAAGEVTLLQSLADETSTGEICTGIQKLAQRFLLMLLTDKGSVAYASDYGTTLITDIRLGRIQTDTELRSSFDLAAQDIALQMAQEEQDDDPADEIYKRAELMDVTLKPGYAWLSVRLYSASDQVDFIVPVKVVV